MSENKLKRIAFGALIVISALLAFATVYEKAYGTESALDDIYGSWWHVCLWAVFGVASFAYMFSRKLYRRPAVFILHCALGLIMLGALTTHLTSERGYMHIRQGETVESYTLEDDVTVRPLPFRVKLVLFDIEYHSGTWEPADYISFLKVDDEICRVSMNKIESRAGYRLYQHSYDPDEMGTLLLVNHDPWGIGITYAGYLLLGIAMLWLLWRRMGWKGMAALLIPTVAVWYYISQINPMTPILRSPMLAAHVSVIVISYALLLFIAVTSVVGLCSARRAGRMYSWNTRLLYPAVFLLAAGIFIGAVWANISWGRYWGWDAKETWALITMLVYSVPFHRQSLGLFRRRRPFFIYCIAAFLTIVMTFFGVTYLLGGIHSYI